MVLFCSGAVTMASNQPARSAPSMAQVERWPARSGRWRRRAGRAPRGRPAARRSTGITTGPKRGSPLWRRASVRNRRQPDGRVDRAGRQRQEGGVADQHAATPRRAAPRRRGWRSPGRSPAGSPTVTRQRRTAAARASPCALLLLAELDVGAVAHLARPVFHRFLALALGEHLARRRAFLLLRGVLRLALDNLRSGARRTGT